MAKLHIPLIAALALAALTAPSLAGAAHPEDRASLTTASTDKAPAAPPVVTAAPQSTEKTALSVPETSAYRDCAMKRRQQTVQLTH